jgi:hypothetical protein
VRIRHGALPLHGAGVVRGRGREGPCARGRRASWRPCVARAMFCNVPGLEHLRHPGVRGPLCVHVLCRVEGVRRGTGGRRHLRTTRGTSLLVCLRAVDVQGRAVHLNVVSDANGPAGEAQLRGLGLCVGDVLLAAGVPLVRAAARWGPERGSGVAAGHISIDRFRDSGSVLCLWRADMPIYGASVAVRGHSINALASAARRPDVVFPGDGRAAVTGGLHDDAFRSMARTISAALESGAALAWVRETVAAAETVAAEAPAARLVQSSSAAAPAGASASPRVRPRARLPAEEPSHDGDLDTVDESDEGPMLGEPPAPARRAVPVRESARGCVRPRAVQSHVEPRAKRQRPAEVGHRVVIDLCSLSSADAAAPTVHTPRSPASGARGHAVVETPTSVTELSSDATRSPPATLELTATPSSVAGVAATSPAARDTGLTTPPRRRLHPAP